MPVALFGSSWTQGSGKQMQQHKRSNLVKTSCLQGRSMSPLGGPRAPLILSFMDPPMLFFSYVFQAYWGPM